jgi:hypothetical protein
MSMASSSIEVDGQIVKIEPGGKYVLLFQHQLSRADAAKLQADLQQFMTGEQTFAIVAGGGVSLVRVDEAKDGAGRASNG